MFTPWDRIPLTTAVSDLYATSILAFTDNPPAGLLMRCGPGLEGDSAVVVHARVDRANALRMRDEDVDTMIGTVGSDLLPAGTLQIMAIPHITWKHPQGSRWWRTPFSAASALVAAVLVVMVRPPFGALAALPVAGGVGLVVWFLLRTWAPTRVAAVGNVDFENTDILQYAMALEAGGPPHEPATRAATTPDQT